VTSGTAAAVVRGAPVSVAEVDERLARLREGAFGVRLPGPHTAEGRNARRWVVQLLCAERIVRQELAARGAQTVAGGGRGVRLDHALALGGVAAAVLAAVPGAEALLSGDQVSDDRAGVAERDVVAYYERNPDLYADRGVRFDSAREGIEAELRAAASGRRFAEWLDERMRRDVTVTPGFEHPAEPGHPDSTHRH
jgi:[acyl-carrier-protein] S-malonyltransferase